MRSYYFLLSIPVFFLLTFFQLQRKGGTHHKSFIANKSEEVNSGAQKIFNIKAFGAVGNGRSNDAHAIQKAIDACSAAGGGIVLVPSGNTFLAGPFNLKSFVELNVEAGARLLASSDQTVYTKSAFRENTGEGTIWIGGE